MHHALSLYTLMRRNPIIFILLSFLTLWLIVLIMSRNDSSYELIIAGQQDDHVFIEHKIEAGDEIELSWIHSVEKTPWKEKYVVLEDRQLLLTEIKLASFGAGVPHQKGVTKIEDGFIVMSEINEKFADIKWIHSHHTNYEVSVNGHVLIRAEDLPHHIPIVMNIKKE